MAAKPNPCLIRRRSDGLRLPSCSQGPAGRGSVLALAAALIFFGSLATAPPARSDDFAEGLAAYDGGDYATAAEIWRGLAEAGDPAAQSALAELYAGGFGVPRDAGAALRWYRAAARQGHAAAQLNLGDLYRRGLGVARDPVRAYVWFSLAAAQGQVWAAQQSATLERELSSEQRARAEELLGDLRTP